MASRRPGSPSRGAPKKKGEEEEKKEEVDDTKDMEPLLALKKALDDPEQLANWNKRSRLKRWSSIRSSDDQFVIRVTELDLKRGLDGVCSLDKCRRIDPQPVFKTIVNIDFRQNPGLTGNIRSLITMLPGLKKLQFSGTNVDGTLEDICECCPKIAAIYIADTKITGDFKDLLPVYHTLEEVAFRNTEVTGNFGSIHGKFPALTKASLSGTKVAGNVMPLFNVAPNLTLLTLEGCSVWCPSFIKIAEAAPGMAILELKGSQIKVEGHEKEEYMQKAPSLKKLGVDIMEESPDMHPLIEFREAMGNPKELQNWTPQQPFDKWSKIKQAAQRVTDLDLKKLFGEAPTEATEAEPDEAAHLVSFDHLASFRHTFITLSNIDFRNNPTVGGDITYLLRAVPYLKKIQLSGCKKVGGTLKDFVTACPQLVTLYVADTMVEGDISDLDQLADQIEEIAFKDTAITGTLNDIEVRYPHLKKAGLSHTGITGDIQVLLAQAPKLEVLTLEQNPVYCIDLETLAPDCQRIKQLMLGNTHVKATAAEKAKLIEDCPALTEKKLGLDLVERSFKVSPDKPVLLRIKENCKNPSECDTWSFSTPMEEWRNIETTFDAGGVCRCTHLALSAAQIKTPLKKWGYRLAQLPMLEYLDLRFNHDLKGSISDMYEVVKQLKVLKLSGTQIEGTISKVASLAAPAQKLEVLYASDTRITGLFQDLQLIVPCLVEVALNFTKTTGTVKGLSSVVSVAPKLKKLGIRFTEVRGTLAELRAFAPFLSHLNINSAAITGTVDDADQMECLEHLRMTDSKVVASQRDKVAFIAGNGKLTDLEVNIDPTIPETPSYDWSEPKMKAILDREALTNERNKGVGSTPGKVMMTPLDLMLRETRLYDVCGHQFKVDKRTNNLEKIISMLPEEREAFMFDFNMDEDRARMLKDGLEFSTNAMIRRSMDRKYEKVVGVAIGNGNYAKGKFEPTVNIDGVSRDPAVDAEIMQAVFQENEYDVALAYADLDSKTMNTKIMHKVLPQVEPGTMVVFYYGGHGVQIQRGNTWEGDREKVKAAAEGEPGAEEHKDADAEAETAEQTEATAEAGAEAAAGPTEEETGSPAEAEAAEAAAAVKVVVDKFDASLTKGLKEAGLYKEPPKPAREPATPREGVATARLGGRLYEFGYLERSASSGDAAQPPAPPAVEEEEEGEQETEEGEAEGEAEEKAAGPEDEEFALAVEAAFGTIFSGAGSGTTVVVMRGIPGSGKSTLASKLEEEAENKSLVVTKCSADDFFVSNDGEYVFDPAKIRDAHEACFAKFETALAEAKQRGAEQGGSLVVIDNTNTRLWEYAKYLEEAQSKGVRTRVLSVVCAYEEAKDAAAARNSHGVPRDAVTQMWQRWEDGAEDELLVPAHGFSLTPPDAPEDLTGLEYGEAPTNYLVGVDNGEVETQAQLLEVAFPLEKLLRELEKRIHGKPVAFCFQPEDAPTTEGYVVDSGARFGPTENLGPLGEKLTYGWTVRMRAAKGLGRLKTPLEDTFVTTHPWPQVMTPIGGFEDAPQGPEFADVEAKCQPHPEHHAEWKYAPGKIGLYDVHAGFFCLWTPDPSTGARPRYQVVIQGQLVDIPPPASPYCKVSIAEVKVLAEVKANGTIVICSPPSDAPGTMPPISFVTAAIQGAAFIMLDCGKTSPHVIECGGRKGLRTPVTAPLGMSLLCSNAADVYPGRFVESFVHVSKDGQQFPSLPRILNSVASELGGFRGEDEYHDLTVGRRYQLLPNSCMCLDGRNEAEYFVAGWEFDQWVARIKATKECLLNIARRGDLGFFVTGSFGEHKATKAELSQLLPYEEVGWVRSPFMDAARGLTCAAKSPYDQPAEGMVKKKHGLYHGRHIDKEAANRTGEYVTGSTHMGRKLDVTVNWHEQMPLEIFDCVTVSPYRGVEALDFTHTGLRVDLSELSLMLTPMLKRLMLDGNAGTTGELATLAPCTNMEVLHVAYTQIRGDIAVLGGMPELNDVYIPETALVGDVRAFSKLPKLANLNMRMCKGIGGSIEAGLSACAPALTQCNLKFTKVTGSIEFFAGLGAHGNLTFLSVAGTVIGGDIGCLSRCPSLKSLDIRGSKVTGHDRPYHPLTSVRTHLYLSVDGSKY